MNSFPVWILGFLRRICPDVLIEEIEGDLIERFDRDIKVVGLKSARRRVVWNALRFCRPGIILRNKLSIELNYVHMYRNYFKVMMRSLLKRKLHSFITISGLAVSITFAMLAGIFSWNEFQVNKDLKDADRLYLLESKYKAASGTVPPFFVPALLGQRAVELYPGVFENFYRFRDRNIIVSKGDKHFQLQSMIGDSTFHQMFGLAVLHGDAANGLTKPNSIVISEKTAQQFFGKAEAVGEFLTVSTETNGLKEFIITAVLQNPKPKNSVSDFMNMNAQVFLSQTNRSDFNLGFLDDWRANIITYVKLKPKVNTVEAFKLLNSLAKAEYPDVIDEGRSFEMNPLSEYYLITNHSAVKNLIIVLDIIVFFVVFLAVTNFVNISIASSLSRLKEIGIRKVVGGLKKQLIVQLLFESLLTVVIAGAFSLLFYQILYGYFGDVLQVSLPDILDWNIIFWSGFFINIIVIAFLAGIYPSLYLSTTKTIESLKGKFKSVKGAIQFSSGLLTFQFLIAAFVLIASFVLSRQMSYFMESDLGYDKSFVMIVSSVPRMWNDEGMNSMEAAKHEFLKSPKVASVSLSWGSPNFNFSPFSAKINIVGDTSDHGTLTTMAATDEDYAKVYGLKLVAGEFLINNGAPFQADQLVVNEAAQKSLHVNVGDKVKQQFSDREFTIAGIVKDFHFESMHEPIKPVAFTHTRDFKAFRFFSFKLNAGSISDGVEAIEKSWRKIFPNEPFIYSFTDERLALTYKTEIQLKKASSIASVLILIIVLSGVLGLVSLNLTKRRKEIGVRKVLGATASNILILISREYAKLMLLAFVLCVPVCYFFIAHWLSDFAYHIQLTWWMFVVPIAILFCITISLVSLHSFKTAMVNPAKSLKYE